MAKNKNRQAVIAAGRKSLEERMAAQRAAEAALKRKRYLIAGGAVLAAALAIMLIVVFASAGKTADMSGGRQTVATTMTSRGTSDIAVKAGTPVTWTIKGASGDLGCMDGVRSQLFAFKSVSGGKSTAVSFTPENKGTFTVYCSHGVKVCVIKVT
jgi:plastocyanin